MGVMKGTKSSIGNWGEGGGSGRAKKTSEMEKPDFLIY